MNLQTIFLTLYSLVLFFIPRSKTTPVRLAKKQPWRVTHEEDLILIMGFVVIALMLFIAFAFVGQMDPWNNGVMV